MIINQVLEVYVQSHLLGPTAVCFRQGQIHPTKELKESRDLDSTVDAA